MYAVRGSSAMLLLLKALLLLAVALLLNAAIVVAQRLNAARQIVDVFIIGIVVGTALPMAVLSGGRRLRVVFVIVVLHFDDDFLLFVRLLLVRLLQQIDAVVAVVLGTVGWSLLVRLAHHIEDTIAGGVAGGGVVFVIVVVVEVH